MLRSPAVTRPTLVLALVVGLVTSASPDRAARAAEESSLTLYTVECGEALALDGTPITADVCDTTVDRTFTLVGPSGQEAELGTRLEFALDAPRARAARWDVDAGDDLDDAGTYTLTETSEDPDRQTLFECLLTNDDGLVPADLIYVDGGVQLEWTPADVASGDADGQTLVCRAYSVLTAEDDAPMPGIVRIHAGTASPEGESDLIVREPQDEPYELGADDEAAPVPSLGYTLTDADFDEIALTTPEDDDGVAVSSFPVPPGSYTLTADATDTSVEVSVESGQTVLVFSPLGQPSGDADDETLDLEVDELTPTPAVDETPQVDDDPQADVSQTFAFGAGDWVGAYEQIDTGVYQRDCVAIYGADSPNPSGTLRFSLDAVPTGESELVLVGLDDELAGGNPLFITVNGRVVYQGDGLFASWDPNDAEVGWSRAVVPFASDVLVEGENEIVVTNATDGGAIGAPPYVLLAEATVVVGGTLDAG